MSFFRPSRPRPQAWSPASAAGASADFSNQAAPSAPAPVAAENPAPSPAPSAVAPDPAPAPAAEAALPAAPAPAAEAVTSAAPATAETPAQVPPGPGHFQDRPHGYGRPSSALATLRSQFGSPGGRPPRRPFPPRRRPYPPPEHVLQEPAPSVGLPEGGTIVVRNCSTKRVLQMLVGEFGGKAEDISGRYFIPAEQDLPRIRDFARKNGFFVKESLVAKILMLDIMVDRAVHDRFGGEDAPESAE